MAEAKEVEPSLGIKLLHDLTTVFGDATEMSSKSILQGLHAIPEAPWADLKGKPLDERGLANRLRQYGIRSKTIRIGSDTPKGYVRADFVDVWARYLPSPPASATSATSATKSLPAKPSVSERAVAKSASPNASPAVADVADVALPGGMERRCAHCGTGGGPFCIASVSGESIWLHVRCKDQFRV